MMFGEAWGLGVCWLVMVGSRCGGVGECDCVVAIWFIRSEGLIDWLCWGWESSSCGSRVAPR